MSDGGNREYELVYILQPGVDDNAINALSERVGQIVEDQGGEVLSSEPWGRRQLAYPIANHFEGYYMLHRLDMDPAKTDELDRILRFTDDVIRYMVMRADE